MKRTTGFRSILRINPPGIERITMPFQEFVRAESFSGILLITFMLVALIWANSPWSASYQALWQTQVNVSIGSFKIDKPLLLWINDGLMAIFFFVVGLEIKRELLVGELKSLRQAMFPIAAALGGMIVPAGFYLIFNANTPGEAGWGIPMATDIAFALGILALLGKRAPLSLKVFLTAVAIVDDIGAVLVIALFYTDKIVWASLGIAALIFVVLLVLNRFGVRKPLPYALLGIVLWVAFLKSGVHATVAGVLLAMTIPASTVIDRKGFLERIKHYLEEFEDEGIRNGSNFTTKKQRALLQGIEDCTHGVEAPLQRLEHALHPWVAFFIMPVFALANAGVDLRTDILAALANPITIGIIAGLVIGKQIGITFMAWLVTRLGISKKITGVTWKQIYGVSMLAGIGFTMSLFISNLAFADPMMLTSAKVGILIASFLSAGLGWIVLSRNGHSTPDLKKEN
ncbi:MAG: Na+/H+ antiporter NhaA [Gammaproteobacteria bacterium]|nr:Na+/H+ antiporter NhaA [Gammaproteobacteria bacterium]